MGALDAPNYRPAVGMFIVGGAFSLLALLVVFEIQHGPPSDAPLGAGLGLLLILAFGAIAVVCALAGVTFAVFARRSDHPLGVSGVRTTVVGLFLGLSSLFAVVMAPLVGVILLGLGLVLALSGFALAWRETSGDQ